MRTLPLLFLAASLSLAACKKKEEATSEAPAAKPATTVDPKPSAPKAPEPAPTPTAAAKTIPEVAAEAGSFETLLAAVEAAGLVEVLKGDGPFTVFAPTDEAFAKIPKADLDALLADKARLTEVLTYHVVPGKVMAADVAGLKTAKTVNGQELSIDTSNGVKIDGATVTATDIPASNGVIHVIDTVVLPKPAS